jgi:hypothetical protein
VKDRVAVKNGAAGAKTERLMPVGPGNTFKEQ